jgi:GntR family transcriptional regulator
MLIQIQHTSPKPIYEQLVSEIEERITKGHISENEPLPSIRQLASQLDIAVNTVARAYMELERKGLVVSNGRKGTFVTKTTIAEPSFNRDLKVIILDMVRAGMNPHAIRQQFDESMDQIFN